MLSDLILDDTIPEFDTVEKIEFTGLENYTIVRYPLFRVIRAG